MMTAAEPRFLEFVYTSLFERTRKGVLSDAEVRALEDTLLENCLDGDLVANTGGVRKSRAAQDGRGKSGSTRVMYLYVQEQGTIYFLLAFPKNVQGNLTADQKRLIRGMADDVRREPWPEVDSTGTRKEQSDGGP